MNQIYENRNQNLRHPDYRHPTLVPKHLHRPASNANNNNNSSNVKDSRPPEVSPAEDSQERTKIFVWKRPEDEEEVVEIKGRPSSLTPNVSSPDVRRPPGNVNPRRMVSDSNLSLSADTVVKKKSPTEPVDKEIEENMKSLTLNPTHRFRSRTPTPQTGSDVPTLTQHRRSKTPTPQSNKELMRLRHANKLPPDMQRQRPRSAYGGTGPDSQKGEEQSENGPVAPPRRRSNKSSDSESPTERPSSAMGMPFGYPAWSPGNPMMTMPFNPAMFSPTYYPYMYEWWQYYNSLSPEQKAMLGSMPMANQQPVSTRFFNLF